MSTIGTRIAGALASVLLAALACNGMVAPSVGSETNWVGKCTRDEDCATLSCVCGLCTRACDATTACPGTAGQQTCAQSGSKAFGSTCGSASTTPTGLCLRPCAADVDCGSAFQCEDGACAPIGNPTGSGSPQTMAALEQATIGAPCVTGDENLPDFPGYQTTEINIESHSPKCASGFCIVANFRGRVDCPYGQPADPTNPAVADPARPWCRTFDTQAPVTVPVEPQLMSRRPNNAVYCSCHCDGPEGTGPFCACPEGFQCTDIAPDIGKGHRELAGSYCLKSGTKVSDPTQLNQGPACSPDALNCGPLP